MQTVTLEHFKRAAADIGAHGDNDTLPFDIDNRFISDSQEKLAQLAYDLFCNLEKNGIKNAKSKINSIQVFTERLLTPTGPSGFRISTKLEHLFKWSCCCNCRRK